MIEPVTDVVVWFAESVLTALQYAVAGVIGKI